MQPLQAPMQTKCPLQITYCSRRLFAIPLRSRSIVWVRLASSRVNLASQASGQLGQSCLVGAHAHSKTLEVVKLVGETHSVAIHEDEVASLAIDLVDLGDTLLHHGLLELLEQVLAQAHWPALANTVAHVDVLVHEAIDLGDGAVDLDLTTSEDGLESASWGQTLSLLHNDVGQADVLGDSILSGDSVCLQGEVVVGDLAVVALDHLESLVSHLLHSVGDLAEESLLLSSEVLASTESDSLSLGLTNVDGGLDGLLHVGVKHLVLSTDASTVLLAGSLSVADHASQDLEVALHSLVVGSDGVTEGVHLRGEVFLDGVDGSVHVSLVLSDCVRRHLIVVGVGGSDISHLLVHLLGHLGQVELRILD